MMVNILINIFSKNTYEEKSSDFDNFWSTSCLLILFFSYQFLEWKNRILSIDQTANKKYLSVLDRLIDALPSLNHTD